MTAGLFSAEQWRLDLVRSYSTLELAEEAELDAIVADVSEGLDMPIAILSLSDARRCWVKARAGIDARDFPHEISICAHTPQQGDVLTIEDTRCDPRVADNALVVGAPFLRFYAGASLASHLGPKLGTLCVLDMIPRSLTEAQASILRRAAAQAMTVLNVRRLEKALSHLPAVYHATL